MTNLQALLQQIIINPREDSIRLVYADALEDANRSAEATFIRGALRNVGLECYRYPSGYDVGFEVPWKNILCEWSRGFISEIICTAEDFLKHADQLIWNEEMRIPCPEYTRILPNKGDICKHCGGENKNGYVMNHNGLPKPMPATAQPIEKVKLTTWPETGVVLKWYSDSDVNWDGRSYRQWLPELLSSVYKDIEFELPETTVYEDVEYMEEILRGSN